MQIITFDNLNNKLEQDKYRDLFWKILTLRQKTYRRVYQHALCLDKFDLISTHVVMMSDTNELLAYIRFTTGEQCIESKIKMPFEEVIPQALMNNAQVKNFLNNRENISQSSLLFKTRAYDQYMKGVNPGEFFLWHYFNLNKDKNLSYTTIANSKYKLKKQVEVFGNCEQSLPTFLHPTVPQNHELILLPEVDHDKLMAKNEYSYLLTKDLQKAA